jgi:hypothetical protein
MLQPKSKVAKAKPRIIFRHLHRARFSLFLPLFKITILSLTLMISLDMAARFGGDCTAMALQNRFRAIRRDAKLMNDSIAKGIDPITLPIGAETSSGGVKGSSGQTTVLYLSSSTLHNFLVLRSTLRLKTS